MLVFRGVTLPDKNLWDHMIFYLHDFFMFTFNWWKWSNLTNSSNGLKPAPRFKLHVLFQTVFVLIFFLSSERLWNDSQVDEYVWIKLNQHRVKKTNILTSTFRKDMLISRKATPNALPTFQNLQQHGSRTKSSHCKVPHATKEFNNDLEMNGVWTGGGLKDFSNCYPYLGNKMGNHQLLCTNLRPKPAACWFPKFRSLWVGSMLSRWWFQICFIFTPTWGKWSQSILEIDPNRFLLGPSISVCSLVRSVLLPRIQSSFLVTSSV